MRLFALIGGLALCVFAVAYDGWMEVPAGALGGTLLSVLALGALLVY